MLRYTPDEREMYECTGGLCECLEVNHWYLELILKLPGNSQLQLPVRSGVRCTLETSKGPLPNVHKDHGKNADQSVISFMKLLLKNLTSLNLMAIEL